MKKPNIIGNILYQVSYELFAMLLPLFTAPFISRMLGADMLGVYSYSRTLATYFGLFGMLGVKNYGNREISVHRDTGDLNIWFWSIYSVQFLASLLMLIVYLGYTFFFVREDQAVTAVQAILIVDSMLDISWFLFGMEQFKKTTTCSMVVKILTTAAVFLMIREPGDLLKYCLIMSGGTFINQLLLWFYARKLVGRPVFDGGRVLAHVKPMLILFIPVVAVSLYTMMDKLMLGAMSTNAQMGFYEASERIILCASSVITAFGTVMMPRMTKLFSDGDLRESQRYMKLSVDAIMAIAFAIALGIVSVSRLFAPLGRRFRALCLYPERSGPLHSLLGFCQCDTDAVPYPERDGRSLHPLGHPGRSVQSDGKFAAHPALRSAGCRSGYGDRRGRRLRCPVSCGEKTNRHPGLPEKHSLLWNGRSSDVWGCPGARPTGRDHSLLAPAGNCRGRKRLLHPVCALSVPYQKRTPDDCTSKTRRCSSE